ncbi:MAG: hypothetical protein DMG63_17635 [Acidobacteria bacterium]|nr:MAG: hypothetical protein DMG63_17635 [Acidobacteriota bacterium]
MTTERRRRGTHDASGNIPEPRRAPVSHSYTNNHVHVIYSTYNRQDLIPPAFEKRLYPFVAEIAREHKIPLLAAGGMPNHSHLLFLLPPTMSLADAVNKMSAAPTALGCHIHVTQPCRDWAHIWPAGPPALRFWKFINPDPILLSRSRSMRSTLWIAQLRIFNREGRGLPFELECLRQNPRWMLV